MAFRSILMGLGQDLQKALARVQGPVMWTAPGMAVQKACVWQASPYSARRKAVMEGEVLIVWARVRCAAWKG